jgi:hypothetical protein
MNIAIDGVGNVLGVEFQVESCPGVVEAETLFDIMSTAARHNPFDIAYSRRVDRQTGTPPKLAHSTTYTCLTQIVKTSTTPTNNVQLSIVLRPPDVPVYSVAQY